MILGRLLEALFARGVIFVMTSNYPPDGLYPNGLQRINFLPTIKLIKTRFDVIEIDDGTDYRLRSLSQMETYLVPDDAKARERLTDDFFKIAGFSGKGGEVEVLGRRIPAQRIAPGVGVVSLPRAVRRPALAKRLSRAGARATTPCCSPACRKLTASMSSEARRFTWLIDVLYEHRVKLIMSAEVRRR